MQVAACDDWGLLQLGLVMGLVRFWQANTEALSHTGSLAGAALSELTHSAVLCWLCVPQIRRRNNIVSDSSIKIMAAEPDMYVAEIGESVILKLGPR